MPASVAGRRKDSRAARNKPPPSTARKAPASAVPLPVVIEASPGVPSKPETELGMQQQTQVGTELIIMQTGAPSNKPNVFQFLQEGDSSSTSSENTDSDSDDGQEEEGLQALAQAQPPLDTRDTHSSYLISPESSFRASSPEQTFSVTSRDSVISDPTTSPDGSPATAYLRLANRQNLQKIAQARSRREVVHQRQSPPPTDDEDDEHDEHSDYSAPEDYYMNERMHYHQQKQHQQQQQHRSHTGRPHAHRQRKIRDRSKNSRRGISLSPERSAGQLVKTEPSDKNNKVVKTPSAEPKLFSGYALLASKLDSSTSPSSTDPKNGDRRLVPVYRRFENVNHRIILHLQDEISQLEEELQMMDEYEAKHRATMVEKGGSEQMEPASRRMDVEAAGRYSAFHARRLELVDRLAYKVNQYNDALTNYAKLNRILPKASSKDIQTYRTWMNENTPIAKNETRFLDHDLDLVSLKAAIDAIPVATVRGENSASILYFIIGVLATALLLPLLAY
uniref:DUF6594 domain-containing protein n=1 Tax=Talaromyces marneffei PM1 TaxID=1077442 RepID=A0A093VRF7_TALMA